MTSYEFIVKVWNNDIGDNDKIFGVLSYVFHDILLI
ncbi:unknown [Bacteroides sp. CAG:144]|nr:unknown [Bacteroides sp. CAG:144]